VGSRKPDSSNPTAADRQKAAEEEERRLFEQAMQGVRPLAPGHQRAVPDWEAMPAPSAPAARPQSSQETLHVDADGEGITGAAFGVAHTLIRSLAKGEIPPEAELNLHHAPAHSAIHQAERFIELSVEKGRRCVLLIHGRGLHSGPSGPILRPALVAALGRRPLADHVLAFTSAPPQLGGVGAMLVLLRRPKSSHP
jgi:DNA-nicking Smr family endonuclease